MSNPVLLSGAIATIYNRLTQTKQTRNSTPVQLEPFIKNPYNPSKELGYDKQFSRRMPQFSYIKGNVVGDISPLHSIPFASNVQEVRDINITQWSMPPIDRKKQLKLITDKLVLDEHQRFQSAMRLPQGKKRWRKHIYFA